MRGVRSNSACGVVEHGADGPARLSSWAGRGAPFYDPLVPLRSACKLFQGKSYRRGVSVVLDCPIMHFPRYGDRGCQKSDELMISPPLRVPRARQTLRAMVLLMNRTD